MVHGFNTDVKHRATLYHVQSEYKDDASQPVVETHVYRGGEIVGTQRVSLAARRSEGDDDEAVRALVQEHHNDVIASVRAGSFDPAAAFPADDLAIDELALDFLVNRTEG